VLEIVPPNTVPIPADKCVPRLKILSVAPALAETLRRIPLSRSKEELS
jgi:ribose-phosphate pyrophosphokinase